MTILNWLNQKDNCEQVALLSENKSITYKQLAHKSKEMARLILQQVGKHRTNIAVYTKSNLNYVIGYFAVLYAGKSIVPIKTELSTQSVNDLLIKSHVKWMITDVNKDQQADELKIVQIGNTDSSQKVADSVDVLLLETTGTTNEKKLVRMNETNLNFVVTSYVDMIGLREEKKVNFWLLAPLQSAYGNYVLLACIYVGATIILLDNFHPWSFRQTIIDKRITHIECISSLLVSLSKMYKETKWEGLRYLGFGGESVGEEEIKLIFRRFSNVQISQGYGLTEACPLIAVFPPRISIDNPHVFLSKIKSVGKVLSGIKLKIEKDDPVRNGEILVSGPNLTLGYYGENNSSAFINGYFRTGDKGYLDKEGFLYISGRIKNIAIIKGFNVQLEEVEYTIRLMPQVKEARVYSEKDPFTGERLCAEVVSTEKITENQVKAYLKERLEQYKIPSVIIFTEHLNKMGGKIKR